MPQPDNTVLEQARIGMLGDVAVYSVAALKRLLKDSDYVAYFLVRRSLLYGGHALLHRLPRRLTQSFMRSHELVEGPGWLREALIGIVETKDTMHMAYSDKIVTELAEQSTDASDAEKAQTTAEEALLQITKLDGIYTFHPIVVNVKEATT